MGTGQRNGKGKRSAIPQRITASAPDRLTGSGDSWRGAIAGEGRAGSSSARGYGYDKKTAALSGMIIDGHRLTDHCGTDEKVQRLFKRYTRAIDTGKGPQASEYWEKLARKIGARFANWQGTDAEAIAHHMRRHGGTESEAREIVGNRNAPPRIGRYTSLYRLEGLAYLSAIGYDVIKAL